MTEAQREAIRAVLRENRNPEQEEALRKLIAGGFLTAEGELHPDYGGGEAAEPEPAPTEIATLRALLTEARAFVKNECDSLTEFYGNGDGTIAEDDGGACSEALDLLARIDAALGAGA